MTNAPCCGTAILQVARYHGNTEEEQRQRVLLPLLAAAEAAAAAAAVGQRPNWSSGSWSASESDADEDYERAGSSSSSSSSSSTSLSRPVRIKAARQRVTDLSESQSAVIKGVEQRYRRAYGVQGYGRLVTDVIRAVKAWSKYGLPAALTAGGAAADEAKPPPNYLWEVFVLFVLDQGCR
jgi:hypothetical protein